MLLEMDPMDDIMEDVEEIVQIMKDELAAGKTVPHCTFINILQCVSEEEILQRFIEIGGWASLNDWLSKAKNDDDDVLLLELLKVYSQMPVTVDLLKKNSCAKTIKNLSKSEKQEVKTAAAGIVDLWMKKVKSKPDEKTKKHKSKHHKAENGSTSPKHHKSSKTSTKDSTSDDNSSISSAADDVRPSKTVKNVPSKSRSSGAGEESSEKKKSSKRSSKQPGTPPAPPTKKVKTEQPKPKPPKPKPPVHEIYESSGFMDALTPSSLPTLKLRKRKVSVEKINTTPPKQQKTEESTSPKEEKAVKLSEEEDKKPDPSSPDEKKPHLPSFYKDTLETQDEPEAKKEQESTPAENESSEQTEDPEKVKKKKKVSWAAEANLKTFFYFPMDENERVNVNRIKDFDEIKRKEMMMEKQFNAKALSHEAPTPGGVAWRRPRLIDLPVSNLPEKGINSTEREAQKKREEVVLFALYFDKSRIPDSAKEPDPEATSPHEPMVIPLEDETGKSSQVVFQDYPQPVQEKPAQPQQQQPPQSSFSLPPDVANLLASLTGQQPPQQQNMSPNMAPVNGMDRPPMQPQAMPQQHPLDMNDPNIQQLIQSIMAGQPIEGFSEEHLEQLKLMLGLPSSSYPNDMNMGPYNNNMSAGPGDWHGPMNGPMMMGPNGPMGPNYGNPNGPPFRGGPRGGRGPNMMGGRPRGPPMRGRGGGGPPHGFNSNRPLCHHFMNGNCRFGNTCRKLHPGVNCPPMPGMMGSPPHPGSMSPPSPR